MPPLRLYACAAIAAAAASWAPAELVEVTGDGVTVATWAEDPALPPEYINVDKENHLKIIAAFDPNRAPIAQTATSAEYEALYGYGVINDVVVPLSSITLRVHVGVGSGGSYPSFFLSGVAAGGWRVWVDGYSEDPNFVSSVKFPVTGFSEPSGDLYRRCDIGATGPGWDTYSDQISLPVFRLIPDPPPGGSSWKSFEFKPQYGQLTLTYEVKPLGPRLDGVTGLARGVADSFTDLAATVRLAPSGYIDARNGSRYQAQRRLPYQANKTYRVRLTANMWTRRYTATITPPGGKEVVIAKDYAFRAEQARATMVNALAVYAGKSGIEVRNVKLVRPASKGIYSAGTWMNQPLQPHGNTFTVQYKVTPKRTRVDAVTGLSSGAADWYDDLAVVLRFNPDGTIDARHDGRYRAATTFRYTAGVTYQVRLTVDLNTGRYSATVRTEGGTPRKIADNYRFRREQANVSKLDTFALFSTGGGATEVTSLAAW